MEIDTPTLINIIVVLIIGCGGICSFLIWRHDRTKVALGLRRKLHQNLIAYLVGLFENKDENKHNAQLIFSFHNTYLMEILKPAQLWFCEKSDEGHTDIFSAIDFKDIKELHKRSLEKLYRIGRFGAKPKGI